MNLLKFLLGIILITNALGLRAAEVKSDPERLSKLIDLTNREIKTIHDNTYTGPELKHRLFELFTEKIKLLRERETALMLKEDIQTVQKRGKESYYSQSMDQYQATQKYGINVINTYPTYSKIADIYYTLAINSRDFGTNKETEAFLKLAIKNSKENTRTLHNAKTSLAEYYYNEKKYADAVAFYDEILKINDSEWYGKHLYNAAWCHLKIQNFSKALSLIKESFETTKDKKYVSMKEQILSAIGIFFVQADQANQAIAFFEKNTNPASTYLLMLANSSMDKSNFSITEDILKAALKDTLIHKDVNQELKVRLTQLDIYRESKKNELFFQTSQNIVDLYKKNPKLPIEEINLAMNKIKDVSGYLQASLVKDKTKENSVYNKEDYRKIIKYFDMLTVLDKPHKNQYRYYQGETSLSIQEYHTAAKSYIRAIMSAKKLKDNGEFTKKSLDALMTILDDLELPKKVKDEYTVFIYKNYLLIYPVSDRSQAIYQKIFNKYFELKKTKKATNILLVYKQNYPNDEKIHREMVTQLIDNYIKKKNTDMISAWVRLIETGYLNFSTEYLQNSIAVLGNLLFERYHGLEKKGKIKEAMQGYEEIFDSKNYPNRIKAEAAYAMSAALLDLNNSEKSYKWLNKSLAIYDIKDLAKVTATLYIMNKNYRLLQNFETTKTLSAIVLKKFCNEHVEQKDGFYELLMTTTAMEDLNTKKLLNLETEYSNCKISERVIKRVRSDILDMMIATDKFVEAKEYFLSTEHLDTIKKQMGRYVRFKFFQNPALYEREITEIGKLNPEFKLLEMISHFEQIKAYKEKITTMNFTFTTYDKFDAEKFNSELEQYLSMVNDLGKEAVILSRESSPEEVIVMREVLSTPINALKAAILSFEPKGVDIKYLQGFKAGMRQVSESLSAKALQFDREKVVFIEKNNYFFQIQKHDKFDKSKANGTELLLEEHDAIIFTNTMDVSMIDITNLARGTIGK